MAKKKEFAVDERECGDCRFSKRKIVYDGRICLKHLMYVTDDMHVTYKISDGTCFAPKPRKVCRNEM